MKDGQRMEVRVSGIKVEKELMIIYQRWRAFDLWAACCSFLGLIIAIILYEIEAARNPHRHIIDEETIEMSWGERITAAMNADRYKENPLVRWAVFILSVLAAGLMMCRY
jgi:hypothetical protein